MNSNDLQLNYQKLWKQIGKVKIWIQEQKEAMNVRN
jgi:hypothetical protein